MEAAESMRCSKPICLWKYWPQVPAQKWTSACTTTSGRRGRGSVQKQRLRGFRNTHLTKMRWSKIPKILQPSIMNGSFLAIYNVFRSSEDPHFLLCIPSNFDGSWDQSSCGNFWPFSRFVMKILLNGVVTWHKRIVRVFHRSFILGRT